MCVTEKGVSCTSTGHRGSLPAGVNLRAPKLSAPLSKLPSAGWARCERAVPAAAFIPGALHYANKASAVVFVGWPGSTAGVGLDPAVGSGSGARGGQGAMARAGSGGAALNPHPHPHPGAGSAWVSRDGRPAPRRGPDIRGGSGKSYGSGDNYLRTPV